MPDFPETPLTPPEQNRRNWEAFVRLITTINGAVLEGDRLWKQLTTWSVVSAFVLLGIGSGIGVLSMTPPLFLVAKMCFIGAAILLWFKSIHWLVVSKAVRVERMILAFLIFGITGLVLVEAVKWISRHQAEASAAQAATGLVGSIICLRAETPANTVREIFHGDYPNDFVATLNVSVTNDNAVAATITEFKLSLITNGSVYSCTEIPISRDSFLKRTTRMPNGTLRKTEWEPLTLFPLNTEITNTTRQTGWLKFWTGPIQNLNLDTAKLTLIAFDHRNQPHMIYHGPVRQPSACGEIVEGVKRELLPDWD